MTILEPGLRWLESRTGVPVAGVIPYFRDIHVAEEDSVALKPHGNAEQSALLDIAVVCLPHISNFDDFDPLEREAGIGLRYVDSVDELGVPDVVVFPGSKTTVADLEWLRERGFASRIQSLGLNGTVIIGICGGYQMLGTRILDPESVESLQGTIEGLGPLPMTTIFGGNKETHRVKGEVEQAPGILKEARGLPLEGYEIHMGRSFFDTQPLMSLSEGQLSREPLRDRSNVSDNHENKRDGVIHPFQILERSGRPWAQADGAIDSSGRILGTYIHGLFHNPDLRRAILRSLAERKGFALPGAGVLQSRDEEYDKLASLVRESLDMGLVNRIVGL